MLFRTRKYRSLRVVLDPRATVVLEGRPIVSGLTGKFQIGMSVQFINGEYETSDKKVIEALKAHESYGLGFFAVSEDPEKLEPIKLTPAQVRAENERREAAAKAADTNKGEVKKPENKKE